MNVIADGAKNDSVIYGHKFRKNEIVHAQAKAKEYLIHVDEMLDDCFKSLANYTGELGAQWLCFSFQMLGFQIQVMVDLSAHEFFHYSTTIPMAMAMYIYTWLQFLSLFCRCSYVAYKLD